MKVIRPVVLFFAAMLAHWWWTTHLSFAGLAPQLLLVLAIVIAARQGTVRGMFFGFGWGLFLDVLNPHLFGANSLALSLAAYGAGSARRQLDLIGLAPQCMVVFFMTWAYFLLLGLLGLFFIKIFIWVGWLAFLTAPFYNCAVAAALYPAWGQYLDPR